MKYQMHDPPLEFSLWNREITVTQNGPQCFPVLKKRWGGGRGVQDVREVRLAMKLKGECNTIQGKQTERRASLLALNSRSHY